MMPSAMDDVLVVAVMMRQFARRYDQAMANKSRYTDEHTCTYTPNLNYFRGTKQILKTNVRKSNIHHD
jgi:hypothetical protein